VAEEKTAVAVSSFTPTIVPTYVYKKPEQLKNTEMLSMAGGFFVQSDGKASFNNTLSPFKIGKYMVTYELWYVVKIWAEKNGYKFDMDGAQTRFETRELPTKDSVNPVMGISRRDAIVWCNAYSQMTGLKPLYCSDAEFKNPIKSSEPGNYPSSENKNKGGFDNPYVNWSANGYRLPTEGEWLYAATYIDGVKWLDAAELKNDGNKSGFVYNPGKFTEWLWDFYAEYPASAEASAGKPIADLKDYRGPEPADSPAGSPNVLHGGITEKSISNPNMFVVSIGYRIREYPLQSDIRNGFRTAKSLAIKP
jgi:formylglycine-generating enzyme required for sulfatase activity